METLMETKVKTQSITKEDREQGEYLPFDVIVDREGGQNRRAALLAAGRYVHKCIRMKSDWIHYNSMTERWEYLYIRKMRQDIFTKHWALHSQMSTVTPAAGAAAADGADVARSAQVKNPGAVVEAPPSKKNKVKDVEKPVKPLVSLDVALASAKKVKQLYEQATGKATMVRSAVASQAAWVWANDEKNMAGVCKALRLVETAMTPFAVEFMTSDPKDVRAAYTSADLETRCDEMVKVISPLIKAIDVEVKCLYNMQQGRLKAQRTAT